VGRSSAVATSVLIVDDDSSFRELAQRLLRASNLEVVGQAGDVAEAMAAAKALAPDAALVDVDLPDGDGITLAQQLTALPSPPRVLLTSIDADAANLDEVRDSGASGFVHKAELPNADLGRLLAPD
jgi:DNA-binding NarL/FixJ family response regulator